MNLFKLFVNLQNSRTNTWIETTGMKAYLYQLPDIENNHVLGEPIVYGNGNIKLCQDCGFSLVEISK